MFLCRLPDRTRGLLVKAATVVSLAALLLAGCASGGHFVRTDSPFIATGTPPDRPDVVTFYALGDWGTGSRNQRDVARLLAADARSIPAGRRLAPFVVALGDNVYNVGLPFGWGRAEVTQLMEKTFGAIYDSVTWQDRSLRFHVVPGNHDHGEAFIGKGGWGDVLQQETWAEGRYPNWEYYPVSVDRSRIPDTNDSIEYRLLRGERIDDITRPEPIDVPADAPLTIVAIDSEVLLQMFARGDRVGAQRHLDRLSEILAAAGADWKIVLGHHPVRTNGKHGGFRSARDWFLYPVPIVSFIYNFYDMLFAKSLQDMDHKHNRAFAEDLTRVLQQHAAFYLSGHDHSLQLIEMGPAWQIVSGAAAKRSGVGRTDETLFANQELGFARFDVTDNELWIRFFCLKRESCGPADSPWFRFTR